MRDASYTHPKDYSPRVIANSDKWSGELIKMKKQEGKTNDYQGYSRGYYQYSADINFIVIIALQTRVTRVTRVTSVMVFTRIRREHVF